jgi:hypothetical protein
VDYFVGWCILLLTPVIPYGNMHHGRLQSITTRELAMTKKEAKARKAAWQLALTQGRVVRHNDGMTLTSNKTVHDAKMLVFALRDNGDDSAEIVQV